MKPACQETTTTIIIGIPYLLFRRHRSDITSIEALFSPTCIYILGQSVAKGMALDGLVFRANNETNSQRSDYDFAFRFVVMEIAPKTTV